MLCNIFGKTCPLKFKLYREEKTVAYVLNNWKFSPSTSCTYIYLTLSWRESFITSTSLNYSKYKLSCLLFFQIYIYKKFIIKKTFLQLRMVCKCFFENFFIHWWVYLANYKNALFEITPMIFFRYFLSQDPNIKF